MNALLPIAEAIAARARSPTAGQRLLVAITGAPGAGKSTLVEPLARALREGHRLGVAALPMDGYHLDNAVLDARGWRDRKGAPHTFDADALAADLRRLRAGESLHAPRFDRALDAARAFAIAVEPSHRVILFEGNYLRCTAPPWAAVASQFDAHLHLQVARATLARRLRQRWMAHGLTAAAARARTEHNDLPNADWVIAHCAPADWTLDNDDAVPGAAPRHHE